jgi:hypothetical protein
LHEDHDHDCWAKELLAGLIFVDPSKDWKTHMQQLLPIADENPRGMAGLAKQKFAGSYREFDTDPTDPEPPTPPAQHVLPPHAPC